MSDALMSDALMSDALMSDVESPTRDLRTHPAWSPATGALSAGPWHVETWTEALLPHEESGDRWLAAPFPGKLRLAVVDTIAAAHRGVHQARAWSRQAARVSAGWLLSEPGLNAALVGAWVELAGDRRHPLDGPQTCLAVLELPVHPAGGRDSAERTLDVIVAGDCEVWGRHPATGWRPHSSRQAIAPTAAAAWTSRPSVASDPRGHWSSKLEALAGVEDWDFPPVGVGRAPRVQRLRLAEVDEIVLATDGARLHGEALTDLQGWLRGSLQVAPDGWPHRSPHGDVAVVHARLAARLAARVAAGAAGTTSGGGQRPPAIGLSGAAGASAS